MVPAEGFAGEDLDGCAQMREAVVCSNLCQLF